MRAELANALAVLLSATFVVGCSSEEKAGRFYGTVERVAGRDTATLYLNNLSEPEYLDPGLASESAGTTLVRDLNEGLVGLHPQDLHPVAAVATRWAKSDDNRLFRFNLRPDAKWSDGVPLTAKHFVDAWQRVLTASTGARSATNMYAIHGASLFHQGRLMVLKAETRVLPLGKGEAVTMAKGTALEVHKRLPVRALMDPLADSTAESLAVDPADADKSVEATVTALGGSVKCNGEDDRWFRIAVGGREGWLPGCALADAKPGEAKQALVETHVLPSYTGDAPAVLRGHGLVDVAALTADPAVLGVRATSEHVLEVELERSTPYFLELLATPAYMPVRLDVIARHGEMWTRPENIVTSGAYTLDSHKFRYEITFKPNPHHWDVDKLKLKRIVYLEVEDNFATLNLYKTGEIDWTGENVALPPAFIDMMKGYDDYHPARWIGTYWYEFNTEKPPVDDPLVRRALNVAVDKRLLIDKVQRGGQIPAKHIVPPYTGGGYAEVHEADEKAGKNPFTGDGYDFDPAHGRELLKQAGYPVEQTAEGWSAAGFPPLEVLYNSSEAHRKVAIALQGMWREHLGITVQVRNEEWKVMLKSMRDGNFQIARFGWIGDYNHPHTWLDTFLSYSNNNWTRWKSSEFDGLLQRAAEEGDPEKSIRMYRDAEKLAVESFARLPIYFYTKLTMMKPYLKGNWVNASNKHPVKWMWIDPDWRNNPENTTAYPVDELPAPEPWSGG